MPFNGYITFLAGGDPPAGGWRVRLGRKVEEEPTRSGQ